MNARFFLRRSYNWLSMRAADHLHVEWVGDEAVVLDESATQLHYLNSSAATLWALIQESGFEGGLERLRATFGDAPFEAGEVEAAIQEMQEKGLLVDD